MVPCWIRLVGDGLQMDVEAAVGVEIPRTYGFARCAEEIETWCFFVKKINVKVLSRNVSGDLFLSQTSMLATGMLKSGVNGAHEPFTLETLCCQSLHRNKGMMDGQKLLEK